MKYTMKIHKRNCIYCHKTFYCLAAKDGCVIPYIKGDNNECTCAKCAPDHGLETFIQSCPKYSSIKEAIASEL